MALNRQVSGQNEVDLSCIGDVWDSIVRSVSEVGRAIARGMRTGGGVVRRACVAAVTKVWQGMCWTGRNIIVPVAMTGVNVLGYFIDKILFGSPGLRRYLRGGMSPCDIPSGWRTFVRNNTGWDIYETMHPVINNFFGTLGGWIGIANLITLSLDSIRFNIANYSHILGENGCFGAEQNQRDKRRFGVKLIFGFITLPIVVPCVVISNLVDAIGAIFKNIGLSVWHNVGVLWNLVNAYDTRGIAGIKAELASYSDQRGLPAKIVYGIVTAPLVFAMTAVTNICSGIMVILGNTVLSIYHNTLATFNLLGKDGVMGDRVKYSDKRGLPARIVFGVVTAPIVFAISSITNLVDGVSATVKNMALSIMNNTRAVYNLLGKNGVMGERKKLDDDRGLPAKIIYGILTSPVVFGIAAVTNTIDAVCAILKNVALSIWHNVRPIFNLLGKDGVMGERLKYADDRGLPAKIIYGALTAPVVLAVAAVTNIVDILLASFKNGWLSIWHNTRATFNLLGENGVMGKRLEYADDRGLPAKIIYGILTAPIVFVSSAITNIIDAACAVIKHTALSIWHNTRATFNLLGENGVMGKRLEYADGRGLPAKIIYGMLTAPIVFVISTKTNIIDAACAIIKNAALSTWHNTRATFNLLGENGVMGKRLEHADTRGLAAKIIYGMLTAPIVFVASAMTNIIDAACAIIKNAALSTWHNTRATFNLLGENGVMGKRLEHADTRGLAAKIIYGMLTAPIVFVASTITNLIDTACAVIKNIALSIWHNTRVTFNLLGENGVMGKRLDHADIRGLPAKIFYGALTAPIVGVISFITNTVDVIAAVIKNLGLSIWHNVGATFNFLGEKGVMGPRLAYADMRGLPAKIIYGIVTAPIVFAISTVTNLIDGVCAYFKHYKRTIKEPAIVLSGVAFGIISGPPVFAVRKVVKGLYNCLLKPFVSCARGKPFDGFGMINGALNVATVGIFGVVKCVFKAATGYTSRFGFPSKFSNRSNDNVYADMQQRFSHAIQLAKHGKFDSAPDKLKRIRSVLRNVYGMRHKVETLLKEVHDAYLEYARHLQSTGTAVTSDAYSGNNFFNSPEYVRVQQSIQKDIRLGEENLLEAITESLTTHTVL